MAFSFRAGTNWCHDFPKLARESGFYFNMHRTRVRVDWNRICSINIDKVIQESDFQTVDDNVNNVIDYSLEHEYDVKILDPNFVKLFRLAQLAVEFLLYCKQYLDQSVIILKDELKFKIEENVKLKKELISMTECIKELKERNKSVDSRLSPHGEVHKCLYCPKSFISQMYLNAHIGRRHSTNSPVPDDYKNETEKLHNEIKTLKERLNQTEKLINESNRWSELKNVDNTIEKVKKLDKAENTEESSFTINKIENEVIDKCTHETNSTLISELKLRMENEIENVQAKLTMQEDYWKSKIDILESQYHQDIEKLFSQLKVTQKTSAKIKLEYESKIKDLEKQSLNQSEMINAQTELMHNLSQGLQACKTNQIKNDHSKQNGSTRSIEANKKLTKSKSSQELSDSILESSCSSTAESLNQKLLPKTLNRSIEEIRSKTKRKDFNTIEIVKQQSNHSIKNYASRVAQKSNESRRKLQEHHCDSDSRESCSEEQTRTSSSKSEENDSSSETKTESDVSETVSESITDEYADHRQQVMKQSQRREVSSASHNLKEDMEETFNRKVQNLGVDPDWSSNPKATYKQKLNILQHRQSINAKKYPKYGNIREKLLLELSKKLSQKGLQPNNIRPIKQGLLSKVKMKAMKAFNLQKNEPKSPTIQKPISHTLRPDSTKLFGATRTRKLSLDDAEYRQALNKELSIRNSDSRINLHSTDSQSAKNSPKVKKKASYETIEDFIRGTKKLEIRSPKATSTPTKIVKNNMQQSYESRSDDSSESTDTSSSPPNSPKSNKSVLKTHPGSGSLNVKKRVEFDLDDKNSLTLNSGQPMSSKDEKSDSESRESDDSDMMVLSFSDDKSVHNIADEIKLGSEKCMTTSETSALSTPTKYEIRKPTKLLTNNKSSSEQEKILRVPQAAPRTLNKCSVTNSIPGIPVSNLEADIEEILNIT